MGTVLCEDIRHAKDHSETAATNLMDLSKAFEFWPHDHAYCSKTHCL